MSAALATARDVVRDMDDPLDVLELVHAGIAHLGELAGPALVVTIEPAERQQGVEMGAGSPQGVKRQSAPPTKPLPSERPAGVKQDHSARTKAAGERLAERVENAKAFLSHRPDGTASPKEIRAGLGLPPTGSEAAKALLRALANDPDVVVAGQTRTRRLTLRPGAPILQRKRVATQPMLGSPGNRSDARQEPGLEGRIMAALALPRTVDELALELNVGNDVLQPMLERLERDGDVARRPGQRWLAIP